MPELPEVETIRRGLRRHLRGALVQRVVVRDARLRWPVETGLQERLAGRPLREIHRRAKYLLFDTGEGMLLVHLGMSGSLRLLKPATPPGPHDHVDLCLDDGTVLRYNDPRRFGSIHWCPAHQIHPLLGGLGPEPLGGDFHGEYLHRRARGRSLAVKNFIMNASVVVGVGNIYASESLWRAGIHPGRAAGRIARTRYDQLSDSIRTVLREAIEQGGTTLRDFRSDEGKPGYFARSLGAYGRAGQPCTRCGAPIRRVRLGQRSTFYCPRCQH